MITRLISGGQTGADRAALDFAIQRGIPHGGWVPRGRKTEAGPLPDRYRLQETASGAYAERTEKNVLLADGTLIISRGSLKGGSLLTKELAERHGRSWMHADLDRGSVEEAAERIRGWIRDRSIGVLNVAGPRASQDPEIYKAVRGVLEAVFAGSGRAAMGDGT
ncbi:MAG TPA: putative molybdenum carrier protein [Syntrophales bacterium]|jgi:hypothetical protein|nr:putative molybdenum carrier protein [Syntrophales bacterium]